MRKLTLLLSISILLLNSCSTSTDQSNQDTNETVKQGETITSWDMVNNTRNDNFFIQKQLNKPVTITNLIIGNYLVKNDETILSCVAYSPNENKFILGANLLSNNGDFTLNGNKIDFTEYDLQPYTFKIILSNPEDVKNISFYSGSDRLKTTQNLFNDLITVTGTLEHYGGYEYKVTNATFTKQEIKTNTVTSTNQVSKPTENAEPNKEDEYVQSDWKTIIVDKSYFHDEPKPETKRKAYLVKGQKVLITTIKDDDPNSQYWYCAYKNDKGQTTMGYMLKSDIQ